MKTRCAWVAAICLLPSPLAAQTPSVIAMDEEPHHHLLLKNDVVKVFEIDLAPGGALLMHRHDYDEISIEVGDAATVSTTPGQADILTISKTGDVNFARGGRVHSVRNIGQTAYRSVLVDLLGTQTGARNLCGKQIPDSPVNCPEATADANATRSDVPQFETDQTRVTVTHIRPGQQATFLEPDHDDLMVAIDGGAFAPASVKGPDQPLATGSPVWIARGSKGRIIRNNGDKEIRVVSVAFKQ